MSRVCVVLAGGEGRRMGGAKPLRPFGSTTLIATALELARGYADDVAVAVRQPGQVGEITARLLLDNPNIPGPLAGLSSALGYAQLRGAEAVLTIPCDMPRLPPDLAARLATALDATPAALAAVAHSGGRLHPVCALWRPAALAQLEPYAAGGSTSLRGFAQACGAEVVAWPPAAADPFANANTPDELAALQPA